MEQLVYSVIKDQRGKEVGVIAAMKVAGTVKTNWCLVNPGSTDAFGKVVDADTFDKEFGLAAAVGRIVLEVPSSTLSFQTKRGKVINEQIKTFVNQANKCFDLNFTKMEMSIK